ncbi:MAG: tetratricopeptide repeat protein, partial [Bacteroidales bacterium]|nr:tetratricopeptide repeat protein [Bacteroidales bacterium]
KENSNSLNPYMDRAIEKGTLVIQRHSMYFNDKEYVKWIDDSYLLIGMSYFYKHEYNMAKRTFDYMIKRFQDDPIKYDAMIWLADTYIQLEDWDKAQSLLDLVQSKTLKEPVSRQAEARLSAVYADFYIKQDLYNQAITPLENALSENRNKLLLTRMEFILGQIYQLNKDYEAATEYYTKVIKRNPPYEMSFNAKINLAQSYDVSTGNSKLVIKKLEKMLKDEKNIEYQDQIYYALAEIAIREGNDTLAIQYYKTSVSTSLTNNYQKAISALKLADLYYSYPDYIFAQAYYDSSMMFLPSDFPNYEGIASKTETLTELVTNILIVQEQDSLQDLARMSEADRNAVIQEFIAAYREEEKKKKQEEMQRQQNLAMTSQSFQTKQNVQRLSGGKWYFYNPSTLSYGYTEFIKKWGNRKLEDLWRIKNKQMISYGYDDEITELDTTRSDSTKSFIADPLKPEYYLQNLPMTPELMEASDVMLAEALYKSGYIYKEGIYDFPNALNAFDEYIERFPDKGHVLESYYHLYKIYEQQDNEEQLEYIRNIMVRDYPDSDYAKIIIDPDYNLVLLAHKNKAASLYEETYQAYMNEQYLMVEIYTDEAISSYAEDKNLIPKFEYLRTLAKGKTDGTDSLIFGLQDIITRYPAHEVTPLAQNILNHINGSPDMPEQIVLEDG